MLVTACMDEHLPADFGQNCLQRAYGRATADQISDYLWAKFFTPDGAVRRGDRPADENGPHTGNWFYATIGAKFNPAEQARSPESPAAPHPSNRATRAEIDPGIEAIEVSG